MAAPLAVLDSIVSLFGRRRGSSFPLSLSHLELLAVGCEGTEEDYELASSAAERCLELFTSYRRGGNNVVVFKASACLIQHGTLKKYAQLGVNVEETPCPECIHYRTVVLPPLIDADWRRELKEDAYGYSEDDIYSADSS